MKKNILKSLFVGVLCMLAASCQDTEEYMSSVNNREAQIMFTLSMDTPTARARAAWGQEQENTIFLSGDDKESRIDMSQFIVKIEADRDEYLVTNILKWENKENKTCNFVGILKDADGNNLPKSITPETLKISVYVNMGSETVANEFEQSQSETTIPMWGVLTLDSPTFAPGTRTNVGSVHLLRAMSKLEVTLTDEMKSQYALKGATLNKHNTHGFTFPKDADDASSTLLMDQEGVFNPKASLTETAKDLAVLATDTSYVIYLPEIASTTANPLNVAVKMEEKATGVPAEGSFKLLDYSVNPDQPSDMNLVRNHWYKYEISGFSASEIQVKYNVLEWKPVNMEIGGEGFLFLNKDVVEIYNANIDSLQLKFSSSSPIRSITLKDLYIHNNNGIIKEGATDGVSAYYISKFGQKIQLGTDPGFDISDKDAALVREQVILSNISATAKANTLNGGITIYSPFLADSANENDTLKQASHYDTPRYLEFEVENADSLKASFRVIQYPPVVITNEEGYYSYRDDFTIGAEDSLHHNPNAFQGEFGKIRPERNGSIINFENPVAPFFTLAGFLPYHTHECNEDGVILSTSCPNDYESYEELIYGFMERPYYRSFSASGPIAAVFHRDHYQDVNGNHMASQTILKPGENESNYYQALGVKYYDETTGKYYRRHYTGNFFETFWPKIVRKVHTTDGTVDSWEWSYEQGLVKDEVNNTGKTSTQNVAYGNKVVVNRSKGQADIYKLGPNENYNGWKNYPYTRYLYKKWRYQKGTWKSTKTEYEDIENIAERNLFNHRMYHIKTTTVSNDYVIGYPDLVDVNGNVINSVEGYTAEGEANSRKVSPSFMVASQLGETILPKNEHHYVMPGAGGIYTYAKEQCKEYVETNYTDLNNNNQWDEGEPVTHYNDWRLPTKAEVEMIINYQENSRVMDMLMNGEYYYCASSLKGVYDENTVLSSKIENPQKTGYYMRCVRDVRTGQDDNK